MKWESLLLDTLKLKSDGCTSARDSCCSDASISNDYNFSEIGESGVNAFNRNSYQHYFYFSTVKYKASVYYQP